MRWDAKVLGKVRTEIRFRVQHNYNWMACRVIPLVAQWKRNVEFIAVESLHVARLESQNVCPPPPPPMDEMIAAALPRMIGSPRHIMYSVWTGRSSPRGKRSSVPRGDRPPAQDCTARRSLFRCHGVNFL